LSHKDYQTLIQREQVLSHKDYQTLIQREQVLFHKDYQIVSAMVPRYQNVQNIKKNECKLSQN
jgi:hypothetical protein